MMLDIEGKGEVIFEKYEKFWKHFLHMYGELLQVKMQYNDESQELSRKIFD